MTDCISFVPRKPRMYTTKSSGRTMFLKRHAAWLVFLANMADEQNQARSNSSVFDTTCPGDSTRARRTA